MERSKRVCTEDAMTNMEEKLQKMDIVDHCTRERPNAEWKVYKFRNFNVFASLLKDIPMNCKDTVLTEPILENHNLNCLSFQRNTRQPYN